MTFELIKHNEIVEEYQGINLNEFQFSNGENLAEENIIEEFIHSNSFKEESLKEIEMNNPDNRDLYLRQAFEIENVSIQDFKKLNKENLVSFLNGFWSSEDWGVFDREDFEIIKVKFIELIRNNNSDSFFLLSKDWFNEGDIRIREPERWIYSYNFLIIWIDKVNNTLLVSEWTYD